MKYNNHLNRFYKTLKFRKSAEREDGNGDMYLKGSTL